MRLINLNKNTVLAEAALIAETPFKRIKGLLGRKDFKAGQALIIRPCNSIHTFFMRFPIDVLFLDKNNRIVKTVPSLKPYRITPIYFSARLTIELPAGTIQRSSTQEGDLISFV